eukprot:6214739-Pleurochrysis_carterae.AAC.3
MHSQFRVGSRISSSHVLRNGQTGVRRMRGTRLKVVVVPEQTAASGSARTSAAEARVLRLQAVGLVRLTRHQRHPGATLSQRHALKRRQSRKVQCMQSTTKCLSGIVERLDQLSSTSPLLRLSMLSRQNTAFKVQLRFYPSAASDNVPHSRWCVESGLLSVTAPAPM